MLVYTLHLHIMQVALSHRIGSLLSQCYYISYTLSTLTETKSSSECITWLALPYHNAIAVAYTTEAHTVSRETGMKVRIQLGSRVHSDIRACNPQAKWHNTQTQVHDWHK